MGVPTCAQSESVPVVVRTRAESERAPVAAVVVLLALLVMGWPLAEWLGGAEVSAAAPGPSPAEGGDVLHVVQPGETYWSIAARSGGSGELRARVDDLVAANGHRPLSAGDRVVVPLPE